jgi:hypothetical protein
MAALAPPPRVRYAALAVVTFVAVYGAFRIELAGDFALWDFSWMASFVAGDLEVHDLPRPITASLLMVFAWVRATWRSLTDVEFESTPRQLAGPAGIVIIACILGAASERDDLVARGALSFFAVAIIALAFSQSALSGATFGEIRTGGITTTLLIGSALAAIAGVVVFGVAFAILGEPVADLLRATVRLLIYLTVAPFVLAGEWFLGLFDLKPGEFDPPEFGEGEVGTPEEEEPEERGVVEESVLALLRVVALAVGLAVIVGVILLFTGRWRRYRRSTDAALSVSHAGSFRDDLGSFLGGLFGRGRQAPAAEPADRVVRLYRHMLVAAHDRGRDRLPGQTPVEFAPALRATLDDDPLTDDVTGALVDDLYASRPPSAAQVDELELRWLQRPEAP